MISVVDFVRFSLSFIRLSTFMAVAPLFNMRNVPMMVKLGFAALCALLTMPPLAGSWNLDSWAVLALLAMHEVVIGFSLAFVVILVFSIVNFAGHYVDTPIGFGMASVFDPAIGGQVPVFSQFYYIFAVLIFLGVDAHLWLIQAVQYSFQAIPFGTIIQLEPAFSLIMDLIKQVFIIGIQIALPITATILLTDIGLGIVIRAVPQINVFVLGFPIKILVGLVVVFFGLPTFIYIASQLFAVDGLLFRYVQGLLALGGS
ncbi:MAG TPA: flagellar biosynthetic protein FliR [Limnochordia bacterium]|nr:flagellar biosynthetic protein FliR [Limnochordia bacterium]